MPSRYQLFVLWCAAHRRFLGWLIIGASLVLRYNFSFSGHSEWADHLKELSILLLASGAYTAAAGTHNPDEYWKEKKLEATLPPQERSPRRRKNDA